MYPLYVLLDLASLIDSRHRRRRRGDAPYRHSARVCWGSLHRSGQHAPTRWEEQKLTGRQGGEIQTAGVPIDGLLLLSF